MKGHDMSRPAIIFLLIMALAGCMTGTANLYPANDIASHIGNHIITMNYKETHKGRRAEADVTMPDGEVFTGEVSVMNTDQIGFGTIYGSVYGRRGVATAQGTSTFFSLGNPKPFTATLLGNRGGRLACEGYTQDYHGAGACEHSNGALYRMHF
jgi:hypothetical protein